jgi:hypothetical protein
MGYGIELFGDGEWHRAPLAAPPFFVWATREDAEHVIKTMFNGDAKRARVIEVDEPVNFRPSPNSSPAVRRHRTAAAPIMSLEIRYEPNRRYWYNSLCTLGIRYVAATPQEIAQALLDQGWEEETPLAVVGPGGFHMRFGSLTELVACRKEFLG